MKYIDFHTHIIPNMDDGAQSIDEAISMLKIAYKSGAETVVLTPHYNRGVSVSDFCNRRDEQVALLKEAMEKDGDMFPSLRIGAEVLVDCALSDKDDLRKLCIDGTDTILLEFPLPTWSRWHVTEIHNIISKQGLTPVIAHTERYLTSPKQIHSLDNFVYYGAKFQVNASAFLPFSSRRIIKAMIKEGLVSAIASDCHNETTRTPDIARAIQRMTKCFDEELMDIVHDESCKLLAQ